MDPSVLTSLLQQMQQQQQQMQTLIQHVTSGSASGSSTGQVGLAPSLPPFGKFLKEEEKFSNHFLRFEQHVTLFPGVEESQKKACFLSSVGPETFQLLQNLFPDNDRIQNASYSELNSALLEHYRSLTRVQSERHLFYCCKMKPNQSYQDWVAELRGLAKNCDFKCKASNCTVSYVDLMIRDQIIKETPHVEVRKQCLQQKDPSLADVISIALAYVTTNEALKTLQGVKIDQDKDVVCKMSANYSSKRHPGTGKTKKSNFSVDNRPCYRRCLNCFTDHKTSDCPHKNKTCHFCKKVGHLANVCVKKVNSSQFVSKKTSRKPSVNVAEEMSSSLFLVSNQPDGCDKKDVSLP